jgi:predicted hotdog family 3-hydroxylacyl-ACP dehydratase
MKSAISTVHRQYSIIELLPHRPPMCWLDELVAVGADHITTRLTIRADAPFYEIGRGMPSWVGLEYMAQTASAFSGYERVSKGFRPQIGLLLGTRHYHSKRAHFSLGAVLEVHATLLMRDEANLVAFDCKIRQDDALLAHATVKAILPDDLQAVLAGLFDKK